LSCWSLLVDVALPTREIILFVLAIVLAPSNSQGWQQQ
jgi:hypothetical protein